MMDVRFGRRYVCDWLVLATVMLVPSLADAVSPPPLTSERGVVASDNAIASLVGAEVLASGGTAADAAVAVALTLGVVQPFASGLGGGGFCLAYDAETAQVVVLDFRETAPAAATRHMYLDAEGKPQPMLSRRGGLAVGVPGELAGLRALHERFGKRPWSHVVAPAAALAGSGYPAGSLLSDRVGAMREELAARPAMATWLLPGGSPAQPGEVLRNEPLAATLRAIASEGPEAFYGGARAQAIVAAVTREGGIMSLEDLASYAMVERQPVHGTYRGLEVYSMPPPSSGGIAVIEALNILEGYALNDMDRNGSATLHLIAEASKFAFADRAEFLGDPAFTEVPVQRLLSKSYAETLRALIEGDNVLSAEAYGPARYTPNDDGTSHFSVVDAAGNATSCTSTINTSFGSLVFVEELGLVLNNQMDDFVQAPGVPNAFGLLGSQANAVAAGKRPLSSMSPTIVVGDQGVQIVVGASGGPQIISGVLQVILNVVDWKMTAREAVEHARSHHQWAPDTLFAEPEVAEDVVHNLVQRGHSVVLEPAYSAVQVVVIENRRRHAASDPRKRGQPAAEPGGPAP